MSKTILLTGYEPFAHWSVNPTAVAAEALDGMQFAGYTIVGKVIPLRYYEIEPVLRELIETYNPDAVILSGQAGGDKIRLERIAQNKAESSSAKYNCGTITTGQYLVEGGQSKLRSSLPLNRYFHRLGREDIPVRYSDSAGLFGCNQVFYLARSLFPDLPAGFIHVPLLPEQVGEKSKKSKKSNKSKKSKKPDEHMQQGIITRALQLICEETALYLSSRKMVSTGLDA
jgi:pyroglutamyl-peptidase